MRKEVIRKWCLLLALMLVTLCFPASAQKQPPTADERIVLILTPEEALKLVAMLEACGKQSIQYR